MEKTTREMVSTMRTEWDIPEKTKLLAYSTAYRFKAELWRKQTREQFLGMERRLQSLFQPTKSLAAADFGRICRKDSHPAGNVGWGWFFSCFLYPSILMFPTSWAIFSNCVCFCANGTSNIRIWIFCSLHKRKHDRKTAEWFCFQILANLCWDRKEA